MSGKNISFETENKIQTGVKTEPIYSVTDLQGNNKKCEEINNMAVSAKNKKSRYKMKNGFILFPSN